MKRFDEREFSDEVLKNRQIEAHYICPSLNNLFDDLDAIMWHQDEPFVSTSIYAQWLVFSLAAENHVKVMLDGQGADEQLCGYHVFFLYRFTELFSSRKWITLIREIRAVRKQFGYPVIPYLEGIMFNCLPGFIQLICKKLFLKEKSHPSWINISEPEETPVFSSDKTKKSHIITTLSAFQLRDTSLPMLLHWEDRDSMAHSVESRVPFLDQRLVELVLGLPSDMKIKGDCTKMVLRNAMAGTLPEKIRTRKDKLGFVTAEEEWIKKKATAQFRTEVKRAVAASRGVLNEQILTEFEAIISGNKPFSYKIWRWICFGRWMERFAVTL